MKKLVQLFIVTLLLLTILVGCVSPIKKYQKAVNEAQIEADLENISEKAIEVNESLDKFFDSVDYSSGDITLVEGFTKEKELLDEYRTLVESIKEEVSQIDTSNGDVQELNENLLQAITNYSEFGNTLNNLVAFTVDIYAVIKTVNDVNEQLNSLGDPSEAYSNYLITYMNENQEQMDAISTFDYESTISSGEINTQTVQVMKENLQKLIDGLADMSITTDIDTSYNDLLIGMYQAMNNMIDLIVANEDVVVVLSSYKSGSDYTDIVVEESDRLIEEWKKNLE